MAPYFLILASSLLPMMVFQAFKQFAEGFSITKSSMYIALAANGINLLLNYGLIYGKWGFPAMGIEGAGVATLIARVVMAIGMVIFTFQHKELKVHAREMLRTTWHTQHGIHLVKLGIPIAMQMFFEVAAFASATVMMGWINAEAIAAHQIAINMASVTYMIATGLSAAATVQVGFYAGRGHSPSMLKAGHAVYSLVLFYMGICALLFVLLRHWLPSLYIHDSAVEVQAASLLLIAALFQLSDGAQVAGLGALRGMKDVKIPTMITLLAYWILGLPVGYVLAFVWEMGAEGIWYGLLLGLTVAAFLLYFRFRSMLRRVASRT
jgi:MATE family multidrug resistance protein